MFLHYFIVFLLFVFNDTATPEIYTDLHTLSLHDALPLGFEAMRAYLRGMATCLTDRALIRLTGEDVRGFLQGLVTSDVAALDADAPRWTALLTPQGKALRSEEHTSELQSPMRISYAVFCLTKKKMMMQQHST